MSNNGRQPHPPAKNGFSAYAQACNAWLTASRYRAIAGVSVLLVLVLVTSTLLLRKARNVAAEVEKRSRQPKFTAEMALAALDRGSASEARRVALNLKNPADRAVREYVLGCLAVNDALSAWGPEKRERFATAAKYLKQARSLGFPNGRKAEGEFQLGRSLYGSGERIESRTVLEQALAGGARDPFEIHRLLARCYRSNEPRDLRRSLAHVRAYLTKPDLAGQPRQLELLFEARVLWELGEVAACAKPLAEIQAGSNITADANVLRGQILMHEAQELDAISKKQGGDPKLTAALRQKLTQAKAILREAQDDPINARAKRRAMYLIGMCLLAEGDSKAALAQFTKARKLFLDTTAGLVASLYEAELLDAAGQADEAQAAYHRTLAAVRESELRSPLLAEAHFRARILKAYENYLGNQRYAAALGMARHLSPLLPEDRATELTAQAYASWGQKLLSDVSSSEHSSAESRAKGRELMRKAGESYTKLAALRFTTRSYPTDTWHAVESYLKGQNYTGAVDGIHNYLAYELRARPRALVDLGQALLALGKIDEALSAALECLDFYPADAAIYEARLLAATLYGEQGNVKKAEALLRENLEGDTLAPESQEWRRSLFVLGELLFEGGRFEEAIGRLQEAVARYGDDAAAAKARYLIAQAYRAAARTPQEKLRSTTIETARAGYLKQVERSLASAIANYEEVQRLLNAQQEKAALTQSEQAMLRNSYFAVGAALFDLGRYEDAIRAYSTATNRYQHEPEALDAFVQIASCYRKLNKPLEARGTVQQAKMVLNRIDKSAAFNTTTNYTRDQWIKLLDWLSSL